MLGFPICQLQLVKVLQVVFLGISVGILNGHTVARIVSSCNLLSFCFSKE